MTASITYSDKLIDLMKRSGEVCIGISSRSFQLTFEISKTNVMIQSINVDSKKKGGALFNITIPSSEFDEYEVEKTLRLRIPFDKVFGSITKQIKKISWVFDDKSFTSTYFDKNDFLKKKTVFEIEDDLMMTDAVVLKTNEEITIRDPSKFEYNDGIQAKVNLDSLMIETKSNTCDNIYMSIQTNKDIPFLRLYSKTTNGLVESFLDITEPSDHLDETIQVAVDRVLLGKVLSKIKVSAKQLIIRIPKGVGLVSFLFLPKESDNVACEFLMSRYSDDS